MINGISPATLLDLVRSTAPFLFDGSLGTTDWTAAAAQPEGFLAILRDAEHHHRDRFDRQRSNYFLLCLSAHHATVGSFVPTDVDGKIRGVLWRDLTPEALAHQAGTAIQAARWTVAGVSTRAVTVAGRPLSGHDGEHLSVLLGALGAASIANDAATTAALEAVIEAELAREAAAVKTLMKGDALDLLRVAWSVTHNAGDVDQAIGFWPDDLRLAPFRERWGDLAHGEPRYGGGFHLAARLYSALLAAEGHRNYPLRSVKGLRKSADLLLPLGPFLDAWGETVGAHPGLNADDRAEVVAALLAGCRKVPGQEGYYRALAGLLGGLSGRRLTEIETRLPGAARGALKDGELRRKMAVPRSSFESSYRKRAKALVAGA